MGTGEGMKRNRRHRISISTQVIIFFIVVVLVQSVLTQIGMYMLIYQSNIDSYEDQLETKMAGVASYLEQSQEDLDNIVSLLAGQKDIIEYTDYRLNNLLTRELSLFNQALGLSGIFVFSENGALLGTDDTENSLKGSPPVQAYRRCLLPRFTEFPLLGCGCILHLVTHADRQRG